MGKRMQFTALSKAIFSLPLAQGDSPFDLSTDEMKLGPEDWAWHFLRLNPLYQHDYILWKEREERWKTSGLTYRPNGVIVPLAPGAPASPLPSALRDLDSRYFVVDRDPLGSEPDQLAYNSETLGRYIERHPDLNLKAVRVRDFDAARDYGIGAWLSPEMPSLPPLPHTRGSDAGSWFYHFNEPIWAVSLASRMRANLVMAEHDGQRFGIGRDHFVADDTPPTKPNESSESGPAKASTASRQTIPLMPNAIAQDLAKTQLRFLVCLDGYVRPQLTMAFRMASEFKALHKKADPKSVQQGAPAVDFTVEGPLNAAEHTKGLLAGLTGPATRVRRNWCVVTVDVAGPLDGQKRQLEARLKELQNGIEDQLTYPIRHRARNEKAPKDNALKRALCVTELFNHTEQTPSGAESLTAGAISRAIYGDGTPEFRAVRDLPALGKNEQFVGGFTDPNRIEQIESGLCLGIGLALGKYEFVASRRFED